MGIAGARIELLDLHGNVVQVSYTDQHGNYQFDVPEGTYKVKFPSQAGRSFTQKDVGHWTKDSDAYSNGVTDTITVCAGETKMDIDAGLKPGGPVEPGSIKGRYFVDADRDGLEDGTDPGLAGKVIKLRDADTGQIVATTTTDDKGNYSFDNVDVGRYCVVFEKEHGGRPTHFQVGHDKTVDSDLKGNWESHVFHVGSGQDVCDVDAGVKTNKPGWIKGRIFDDVDCDGQEEAGEAGFGHLWVALVNTATGHIVAWTKTDADGNYQFDVAAGDYKVLVRIDNLIDSYDLTQANVGPEATDSDGVEIYDHGLNSNGHRVAEVYTEEFHVNPGQTVMDIDVGLKNDAPGSISGTVFCDTDKDGVQDIEIIGGDDFAANAGNLTTNGVPGGLTAVETNGGYSKGADIGSTDIGADMTISAWARFDHTGGNYQRVFDFSNGAGHDNILLTQVKGTNNMALVVNDASNGGTVWLQVDNVIVPGEWANWTVTASSDGTYKLFKNGVEIGSKTGQPTIVEKGRAIGLLGDSPWSHDTTLDGAVAGLVIDDRALSADEVAELAANPAGLANEETKPGVTVMLLDADGNPVLDDGGNMITTVTDADGNYHFDDVPAGDYRVKVTAPDDQEFTDQNVGSDDTIDSDVNDGGVSDVVSVDAGEHVTDVDAGLVDKDLGSLSGTVFCDQDKDGIQDQQIVGGDGFAANTGSLTTSGVPGGLTAVETNGGYSKGADIGSTDIGADMTISAWARFDTTGGHYQRVFDFSNGAGHDNILLTQVAGTNNMALVVNDASNGGTVWLQVNNVIVPGEWANWTVTASSDGTYTLFKNGVEIGSKTGQPTIVEKDRAIGLLGDSPWSWDTTLDGAVAGLVIEDRALSADEVADLAANPGDLIEGGKAGVTVVLLDAMGMPVLDDGGNMITTVTDADGNYHFDDIPAGGYRVVVMEPDGFDFTIQNAGSDDTVDSDVNDVGLSDAVYVGAGEHVTDLDAGVVEEEPAPQPGSISGTYFCDEDRDGTDSAGDTDVAGKTVMLFLADGVTPATDLDGNPIAAAITDANGNYSFGNLPAGDYVVMFEGTDDKTFVNPNQGDDASDSDVLGSDGKTAPVTVGEGQDLTDVDAGVEALPGSLSGTYFCDEDRDATDSAGDTDVAGKTVMLFLADGVTPATDIDGNPVANAVTDGNGDYSFTNLAAGDYVVMFEGTDGKSFVAANQGDDADDSDVLGSNGKTAPVTVVAGQTTENVDAGVEELLGSLSGRFFCDEDGDDVDDGQSVDPGLAGIVVTLLDGSGNPVLDGSGDPVTTLTAADGTYSFGDLSAGTYGVAFSDPDNVTDGKVLVTPNVGGDDSIDSDAIGTASNSTITGITVTAGQDTPDNDAGVADEPAPQPGSISGTYFCDEDRDGTDDGAANGDKDVAGKTVMLFLADGVTPATDLDGNPVANQVTDAEGNYSFTNLAAGDYVVMFEDTDGKAFIAANQGDDADDSDVLGSNGKTDVVTVAEGQETKDVDAGVETLPGALSGTYFCDEDGDDSDDGAANGDADVADKTVMLFAADGVTPATDIDGNPVAAVKTDAQGNYSFTNLAPGAYVVMFEATDGKSFIAANQGSDADDSDVVDLANGKTAPVTVVAGQTTENVDAGVATDNQAPVATDDAGEGCAEDDIVVDLSDNYSDADSASVSISSIGGVAIADGQTVTIDGVNITLSGDSFIFDGEVELSGLDIGESETRSYDYHVVDSDGATATATIDVKFCGDANDAHSLMESIDFFGEYQVVSGLRQNPTGEGGFDIKISGIGADPRFDEKVLDAYCLSFLDPAAAGADFDSAPFNTGDIFGAKDADAAAVFNPGQTSSFNGNSAADNLDLVKWIVAQDFEGQGYTGWEVQFAIWELTDNFNADQAFAANSAFGDLADTDFILAQAAANGEGFDFTLDGMVGAIINPNPDTDTNTQPFIVAFDPEEYDCLC